MRKVASRLGIGAMSLYTYVPGRSELIELMIDRVYAEHARPDPARSWRERLEQWTKASWTIHVAHPWLLDYNMARLPIGPHVLDVEESLYAALSAAGFTGAQNVTCGQPDSLATDRRRPFHHRYADEERHTGVSAEAYWESRASFWETYFDADRFPTMASVWADGGFHDPAGWDFEQMITRVLDGIEQLALNTRANVNSADLSSGGQLERLALVAPAEDAPVKVLVLRPEGPERRLPNRRGDRVAATSCSPRPSCTPR